jgi:hypothetical protein
MRHRNDKITMLGRELELLMGERQTLLQVVGASAALIASLDSSLLAGGCREVRGSGGEQDQRPA